MKSVLSRFTHFDVETNLAKTCVCWTNYKYQVCTHPHCTATGLEQIDQHDNKDVRAPDSGDLTQPNFVIFPWFMEGCAMCIPKLMNFQKSCFLSNKVFPKGWRGMAQLGGNTDFILWLQVISPNSFHIFKLFPIIIKCVFLGCVLSEPSPLPHNYIVG